MTERLRSASAAGPNSPKMENDLSPRKTLLVLVIVVGCFAVLWPKVFYPMLVGSANQHIKPSPIDKTTGCCDVISETDVNTIKIMSELCGTIINASEDIPKPLTGKEIVQRCRQEVLETCGIDISIVLQEQVRLGQTVKQILDEIRSLNGSLCLKYNYGVAPWRLGVPHRITVKTASEDIRQERPLHLRSELVHPAFRERGRAIPQPQPAPPTRPPPRVVEGRPGPIPGMRPTIGGAGHVVPPSKQGTSSMSVIMPIYTIGIVIFFTYTLMKILFKKQPEGVGGSLYPPVEPDSHFRKEVFESEASRLGPRLTRENISSKLGDAELDQLRQRLRETELAMERIVEQMSKVPLKAQDLANGTLSNGDAVKPQDEEQPTVKVLGMEMTASCEGGKKWSRPESPVLPTSPPPPTAVPPPQEIYLEGALPAQSQLLVADSATEPEPTTGEDPAVVLSGKMTLSVISLDSENGVDEATNGVEDKLLEKEPVPAEEVIEVIAQKSVESVKEPEAPLEQVFKKEPGPVEEVIGANTQKPVESIKEPEVSLDRVLKKEPGPVEEVIEVNTQKSVESIKEPEVALEQVLKKEPGPVEEVIEVNTQKPVESIKEPEEPLVEYHENIEQVLGSEPGPMEEVIEINTQKSVESIKEPEVALEQVLEKEPGPVEEVIEANTQKPVESIEEPEEPPVEYHRNIEQVLETEPGPVEEVIDINTENSAELAKETEEPLVEYREDLGKEIEEAAIQLNEETGQPSSILEKDIQDFLQKLQEQNEIQTPIFTFESEDVPHTVEMESLEKEVDEMIQEAIESIQQKEIAPILSEATNENNDNLLSTEEIQEEVAEREPETNRYSNLLVLNDLLEKEREKSPRLELTGAISEEIEKLIEEVRDMPIIGHKTEIEEVPTAAEEIKNPEKVIEDTSQVTPQVEPKLEITPNLSNQANERVSEDQTIPTPEEIRETLSEVLQESKNDESIQKIEETFTPSNEDAVTPIEKEPIPSSTPEDSRRKSSESLDDELGSDEELVEEIEEIVYEEDSEEEVEEEEIEVEISEEEESEEDVPDERNTNRTESSSVQRVNGERSEDLVEESKYTTVSGATAAENDISDEELTDNEEVEEEEEEIIEVEEEIEDEDYLNNEGNNVNHVSGQSDPEL